MTGTRNLLAPPLQTLIASSSRQPPPIGIPIANLFSPGMTSAADPTSSPRSTRAIRNLSSPWSHVVRGEHDPSSGGGGGTVPLSPLASPISSPELPSRSPRKPSADSQSPLFSLVPDHGGSDNAVDGSSISRGKKPVWNVPSNGAIESGSVIDTLSWPALSESTRSSPKSFPSESLKVNSDGAVSTAQVRFLEPFVFHYPKSENQLFEE